MTWHVATRWSPEVGEARWLRELRKRSPRLVARYQRPRAPGEGERLPDITHDDDVFRLDVPQPLVYVCDARGARPVWWACCPDGRWMYLTSWEVTEHPSGTISVAGVISNYNARGLDWRGTLVQGIWTTIEGDDDGTADEGDEAAVEA